MSDIQDCIKFIIKYHKILTTIPPIHVYINRINNRLMFKLNDGYKLELQTPETMKILKYLAAQKNNRQKQKKTKTEKMCRVLK